MAETTNELRQRAVGTSDNPEQIKARIKQTRVEMGQTIDEIQTRLSPEYLKKQTQETIREVTVEKVEKMAQNAENKVRSLRRGTIASIKENPIPAALIGVGIGWMLLSDSNGDDDHEYYSQRPNAYNSGNQYYDRQEGQFFTRSSQAPSGLERTKDRISDAADDAKEWVDDKVNMVKDKASETADKAQHQREETGESIRDFAEQKADQTQVAVHRMEMQTRRQVKKAKRSFWHNLNERPMALGVAALAAGALVGLALPSTNIEDRFLGETRDQVVENAKREVKQTAQKVQTVAEHAQTAAVEEAKSEAEKQNLTNKKSDSSQGITDTQKTPAMAGR